MRNLKLYFQSGQLTEVEFQENDSSQVRRSIRGKTGGAFRTAGSFQWTSAVRALGLLMARTSLDPQSAMIEGYGGSLAASLDYALSKQPVWLADMFGCDPKGTCLARRMILRTNPERKRPGPVVLAVNHVYLPGSSIEVFVNGAPCTGSALERFIATLQHLPLTVNAADEYLSETKEVSNG
jgi:hypothetical protein